MIDFEQDKIKMNQYFDVERTIGDVYRIRVEILDNLKDKYFEDIVQIQKESDLIRCINSLLKYLINHQIDGLEIDLGRISQDIKHLKRINDETKPHRNLEEMINKLKWNTRDNT